MTANSEKQDLKLIALCDTVALIQNSNYMRSFILKGSLALYAKIISDKRMDLYRTPQDIDFQCDSQETWDNFVNEAEEILNRNIAGYIYKLVSKTDKSLIMNVSIPKFDFNSDIRIDVDIEELKVQKTYSELLGVFTYDTTALLADKIAMLSSGEENITHRDLYDLYVLSEIDNYSMYSLIHIFELKYPNYKDFKVDVLDSNLQKIYERFKDDLTELNFLSLMDRANAFLSRVYIVINSISGMMEYYVYIWEAKEHQWNTYILK